MPRGRAAWGDSQSNPDGRSQTLLVVRHAPTDWNRLHQYMGWLDPPSSEMTEADEARLDDLASELREMGITRLLCSPLGRARSTAERLAPLGEVRIDPRLREWGLGAWEGKTYAEVRVEYPGWFDEHGIWLADKTPPGGESLQEVERRVAEFLSDASGLRGDTVVITHNGVIRVMRYLFGEFGTRDLFAQQEPPLVPLRLRSRKC